MFYFQLFFQPLLFKGDPLFTLFTLFYCFSHPEFHSITNDPGKACLEETECCHEPEATAENSQESNTTAVAGAMGGTASAVVRTVPSL